MDALTINGLRVPVKADGGAQAKRVMAADSARALDVTLLRIYMPELDKQEWHIITTPLPQADVDAIVAELATTDPLTCTGALFRGGTLYGFAVVTDRREISAGGTLREVVEFELMEI